MSKKYSHCKHEALAQQPSNYWVMLLLMLIAMTVVFISPLFAQENNLGDSTVEGEVSSQNTSEIEVYEARLTLAREMHEIWPIRTKVENALENIAQQVPDQERMRFKVAMRKAINFDSLETASIESMADVFSIEELKAMISFYGSKEGRSVSHKISDYERSLQPVLVKMIDKALLDTKLGSQ